MNTQFQTHLLDEALIRRKEILEQERQKILTQVQQWLESNASQYGINQAYLFYKLI